MKAMELLEIIGYPDRSQSTRKNCEESRELYRVARENKIGSLYITSLTEMGCVNILEKEKNERETFHKNLQKTYSRLVEEIPEEIEYAAVKSVYPFVADFKDIDILIFDDNLSLLKESLTKNGFELVSETPISFDVVDVKTNVQVDIQTNLAVRRVVYLDKNTIEDMTTQATIDQSLIDTANQAADLAIIIAHSVIEQLFILKEFYYALYVLESISSEQLDTFKDTIEKNNLEPACSAFFTITRDLSNVVFDIYPDALDHLLDEYGVSQSELDSLKQSNYQFPHRYSRATGISIVMRKFRNPTFVKSLISELPHLLYPPTLYYLLGEVRTRFTRKHYAHEKRYE